METPEVLLSERRAILLEQLDPSQTSAQAARRKAFDKSELKELAESIKAHGLVNPILVRPIVAVGEPSYEIVAGERRFLAAKLAGLDRIDCNVRHLGDEAVVELQLIENLQRADLHPMHEAESYDELVHKYGHTADEVAAKVGKSRAYVYGRMKLLSLSPKARKAFYAGEISASIAEKLARIPAAQQDDALPEIVGGAGHWDQPMSYREAVEYINREYMLDLTKAPFPTTDAKLNGNAGPCTTCPKRTGNQPELFADIKKGDTCTDSTCFQAKVRAWGQRQAEEARADGREVIDGKDAKKIKPYSNSNHLQGGWHDLGDEIWIGSNYRKVKSLLKKGEKPTILIDPHGTGKAIPIVQKSQLEIPKDRARSASGSAESQQRKRVERENKFRRALWAAVRPLLGRPDDHTLALAAYNSLDSELQKTVWQSRGVVIKKGKYGTWDGAYHEREIAKLKGAELVSFMNDCCYAKALRVNAWGGIKPPTSLLALAKKHKVNVAKIRRETAPKPKAKTKARKHK